VKRNRDIESVEDMQALRMFMLLFDPYSDKDKDGDVGVVVQAMIRFFKAVEKRRSHIEKGLLRATV
jgi:hypothetical protein